MEPGMGIDLLARIIASFGLGVAVIVGIIHFLTYRRERWQSPIINTHVSQEGHLLLSKPQLIVVKLFIDNPSTLPNTIIEVSCKTQRRWFKGAPLKIGNLELTFVDIETPGGKWTSDLRLAVAPHVALVESDWKILLGPRSTPLREGLWKLPLFLSPRSPHNLIIAITSEHEQIDKTRALTITFRDITRKLHKCSLKLEPNQ
jgi:hypothetical protein